MNDENQNVEFKESWRDEYVKWLCGFANAQGGKLYIGAHIQMHVYDDSVEIWNEGELPEGYTQETLFARHSSKPTQLLNQIVR